MVPVVLVVIILVAWIVILGPNVIKRHSRHGGVQSISHFHHQLQVLERSAPEPLVAPAYRLRAVEGTGASTGLVDPGLGTAPKLTVVGAKDLPRPVLAFLGEPEPEPEPTSAELSRLDGSLRAERQTRHLEPGPGWRGPDSLARQRAIRRRRDTLSVLAGVLALTVILAVVTGIDALWAVFALDGLALVAYVAVLVHLRRMAEEREAKLHYLDPTLGQSPQQGVVAGGTRIGGRYAHPASQQAAIT